MKPQDTSTAQKDIKLTLRLSQCSVPSAGCALATRGKPWRGGDTCGRGAASLGGELGPPYPPSPPHLPARPPVFSRLPGADCCRRPLSRDSSSCRTFPDIPAGASRPAPGGLDVGGLLLLCSAVPHSRPFTLSARVRGWRLQGAPTTCTPKPRSPRKVGPGFPLGPARFCGAARAGRLWEQLGCVRAPWVPGPSPGLRCRRRSAAGGAELDPAVPPARPAVPREGADLFSQPSGAAL